MTDYTHGCSGEESCLLCAALSELSDLRTRLSLIAREVDGLGDGAFDATADEKTFLSVEALADLDIPVDPWTRGRSRLRGYERTEGVRTMRIKDRIRAAYRPGISYHALLYATFPPEQFPKAHRIAAHGGPPGCAMAFGKALRAMGAQRCAGRFGADSVWLPRAEFVLRRKGEQ